MMPDAARAARLSPAQINQIAVAVADLPHRVRPTWAHVKALAVSVTKRSWSRQTLSSHRPIGDAYDAKVVEYRRFQADGSAPTLAIHDEEPWERRIADLKADKAELQAKVVEYDERVALHIANAVRLGIPMRELERPVEKPWKGATDSTTGRRPKTRAAR